METRTFFLVAIFLGFATSATTTPETLETSTPEALVESEVQNVLDECQSTDYRTYIKCLKRQKRHHFPHADFDHNCLDSCPKKCFSEHECEMKCSHCVRKTKHRHQIITEYETECSSGECRNTTSSDKELGSTNITTKIDIHNVINNNVTAPCKTPDCPQTVPPAWAHTPPTWPPTAPPTPPPTWPPTAPPTPPPTRPPHDICMYPPPLPCYPYPYPPQPPIIQQPQIPQISSQLLLALPVTAGIGVGYSGGYSGGYQGLCASGYNQWPCLPNWGYGHGTSIDCSGCWIPYYHYKCDTQCYSYRPSSRCTSPGCVGGISVVGHQ